MPATPDSCALSGLENCWFIYPGRRCALPWAGMLRPFGAKAQGLTWEFHSHRRHRSKSAVAARQDDTCGEKGSGNECHVLKRKAQAVTVHFLLNSLILQCKIGSSGILVATLSGSIHYEEPFSSGSKSKSLSKSAFR